MKVENIIKKVARILDVYGLEEYLEKGVSENVSRSERETETLISSLNCVLYELATGKIKLIEEQTFKDVKGEISLSDFKYKPYKILKVTSHGKKIVCEYLPLSVKVGGADEVTVKYLYVPPEAVLSGEILDDFDDERLLLYGTASEFCLRENRFDEAKLWRSKFESVLATVIPPSGYIAERRFL